jgi:putative ABC transport system substrate-binding protein
MAFASLARERASALVVGGGGFLVSRRNQIIALATRHAIPAIYGFREYSADGGLVSYGNDTRDAFRRAKALGLNIPMALQQRADELIE